MDSRMEQDWILLMRNNKVPKELLLKCTTFDCILNGLFMENTSLQNCSYRYSSNDRITSIALWIDGPCTCIAAFLALIGAKFAVRFLYRAGLNKDLTAALFSLCLIDSLLMLTVFLFYSIEAIGMLVSGSNIMYNRQAFTSSLHGVASSMTTSSTMLVIYISFLRFMVVMRPLRYANSMMTNRSTEYSHFKNGNYRKSSSIPDTESFITLPASRKSTMLGTKRPLHLRKILRPYFLPLMVILFSFAINIPVYFEFTVEKCFDVEHDTEASCPTPTVFRHTFTRYKAVLMTLTQTVGPVATMLVLTVITEYRVHRSLKARRKLFESQQRSQTVVLSEALKERVSRTVAIFIAIKFLILRSMPVFFDIHENLHGIESFGVALSVLVRVSDFMIVLNSATNSLAYFGKKRWLEKRLRLRLIKKEEKKKLKESGTPRRMSQASTRPSISYSPLPSAVRAAFRASGNSVEKAALVTHKQSGQLHTLEEHQIEII